MVVAGKRVSLKEDKSCMVAAGKRVISLKEDKSYMVIWLLACSRKENIFKGKRIISLKEDKSYTVAGL